MSDNELNKPQELNDDQLEKVAGGRQYHSFNGKYYLYNSKIENGFWNENWDKCYLCPNCGGPVHYGAWARYFCDACDESWYWENKLDLNLDSGLWTEITKERYDKGKPAWDFSPSR